VSTEPTPAQGWLVITAINTENGGAGSSTFAVTGTQRGEGVERMLVTDGETGEKYMITTSEPGAVPLEVEPYRDLIRGLIAADSPCPGPMCKVSTLGHLLASLTPEQVELVRELDPTQGD
jgi:hypothetical protein